MKSLATVLMTLTLSVGAMHASDRVGAYALIDKVALEPSADHPQRIQISGVFAIAVARNPNDYEAPQRGYLYFELPKEKTELALREWSDLKAAAGKGQVVAIGSRLTFKPRVRKADEKLQNPDVYVVDQGLVRVRTDTAYGPVQSLLTAK